MPKMSEVPKPSEMPKMPEWSQIPKMPKMQEIHKMPEMPKMFEIPKKCPKCQICRYSLKFPNAQNAQNT